MRDGGIALVWGPPRSGTTWLYNVVRMILERAELPAATWTFGQELPADRRPASLIIKAHHAHSMDFFTAEPQDHVHVVTIFRDPLTAFQSLIRTQDADRDELIGWLRSDVDSFAAALPAFPRPVVCREEWIRAESPEMIRRLSTLLGAELDDAGVAAVADALSRERVSDQVRELRSQHGWSEDFAKYDRTTQWHANHIAPPDYVPAAATPEEELALAGIRAVVDELTDRYSLLSADVVVPPPTRPAAEPVCLRYLERERAAQKSGLLTRILRRR
jgi:hypothetical protein